MTTRNKSTQSQRRSLSLRCHLPLPLPSAVSLVLCLSITMLLLTAGLQQALLRGRGLGIGLGRGRGNMARPGVGVGVGGAHATTKGLRSTATLGFYKVREQPSERIQKGMGLGLITGSAACYHRTCLARRYASSFALSSHSEELEAAATATLASTDDSAPANKVVGRRSDPEFKTLLQFLSHENAPLGSLPLETAELYFRKYRHLVDPIKFQQCLFDQLCTKEALPLALEIISYYRETGKIKAKPAESALLRCHSDAGNVQAAVTLAKGMIISANTLRWALQSWKEQAEEPKSEEERVLHAEATALMKEYILKVVLAPKTSAITDEVLPLVIKTALRCGLIDDVITNDRSDGNQERKAALEQKWNAMIGSVRAKELQSPSNLDRGDAHRFIKSNLSKVISEQDYLKKYNLISNKMTPEVAASTYPFMMNAFSKAEHLNLALKVVKDMLDLGVTPPDAALLTLIRCYCDAGQMDRAMVIAKQRELLGMEPSLRFYQPIFDGLQAANQTQQLLEAVEYYYQMTNTTFSSLYRAVLESYLHNSVDLRLGNIQSTSSTVQSEDRGTSKLSNDQLVDAIESFIRKTSNHAVLGMTTEDLLALLAAANRLTIEEALQLGTIVEEDNEENTEKELQSTDAAHEQSSESANAANCTIKKLFLPFGDSWYFKTAKRLSTQSTSESSSVNESAPLKQRILMSAIANDQKGDQQSAPLLPARMAIANPGSPKCPHCGDDLHHFALTQEEKYRIRVAMSKIVATKSVNMWKQLQAFDTWLKEREGFDYIVDGANVAYHKQNFEGGRFRYHQLEIVVDELKKNGKRVLVLLGSHYVNQKTIINHTHPRNGSTGRVLERVSPEEEAILERFRKDDMLYTTPTGANDDWFWMYATVLADTATMSPNTSACSGSGGGRRQQYVVTNDFIRDHKLAFMEPRTFIRWKMNHLINFDFSAPLPKNETTISVKFFEPPHPFTKEVHQTQSGRWHIPSVDHDALLCLSLRPSVK